ncbi:MAG: hypothetical protein R6V03_03405 [Kiritimatiellia bacterium]
MKELVPEEKVIDLLRTGTRADVGSWLCKRRVWACVTTEELIVFGAGKKPVTDRAPLRSLTGSRYNHVTGELLLAPAEELKIRTLKLPPVEGFRILEELVLSKVPW